MIAARLPEGNALSSRRRILRNVTTLRTMLSLRDSAVLAPVYRDADGQLRLVFVVRGPHGQHGGQIAFPGGKREAVDASLLATALREAEEEIGLAPDHVQVLAELPEVEVAVTGFRIAPFLGLLTGPPPAWRRQEREIAEVLEVRVSELLRPESHAEEVWQQPQWPAPQHVPFYRIGSHKLWGATYRIVEPLLPRLAAGEWIL